MLSSITFALLPMLAIASEVSTIDAGALPTLSAEHVRLHRHSNVELLRARVELSPDGFRSTRQRDGATLEILQDFAGSRVWFADRDRGVVHELAPAPAPAPAPDTGTHGVDDTGFLGTEACGGGTSRDEGRGRWRGRPVHAFSCVDERGRVRAIELVDVAHGIVVFRRTPDGLVDELRDIRPRRYPSDHFSPPSRFRRVGAHEFIHGTPPLSMFRESESEIASGGSETLPTTR